MKYLQRLFFLCAISTVIFSCQKEYSIENPTGSNTPTAQWEFKEAGVQFKGPVDTVAVDTIGTYKFLTINGRSTDGNSQITLQVFGADLKVGTYKTPFSLFAYLTAGSPVYQTDQTATDSFTITITKIDTTGVTGTFSGNALSGNNVKKIVDGKFNAVFKKAVVTPPASTDSGQVVLWSKAGCGGGTSTNPIAVTVGGKSGSITKFLSAEPSTCDPAGAYFVKLPVGSYPWVAKCGTDSITGTVTVTKGGCTKQEVNFSAPLAGDYFPTTTNSNWSYLNQGSTPDDTLYVLSTASRITFGGNLFNIFLNDYGTGTLDTSYYRKGGGLYYEYYTASANTLGLDAPTAVEHIFLKDNVAAGTTWKTSVTGTFQTVPVTAEIRDTLSKSLATFTVGTKSYQNVLEVHSGYFATFPAPLGSQQFYLVKQWFAKGVGLIKFSQLDTVTGQEYTIDLTRSTVN